MLLRNHCKEEAIQRQRFGVFLQSTSLCSSGSFLSDVAFLKEVIKVIITDYHSSLYFGPQFTNWTPAGTGL